MGTQRSVLSNGSQSMTLANKFKMRCLEARRVRNRTLEASNILEQIQDHHVTVEQFFQARDATVEQFEKSLAAKVHRLEDEPSERLYLPDMPRFERFQAWLQSHRFDGVITILLGLNVIWMAAELQITGSFQGVLVGVQSTSIIDLEYRDSTQRFFQIGDYVFTGFFTMDVLLRIVVLGRKFWMEPLRHWQAVCMNYIDALVTVVSIVEIMMATSVNSFLFRLLRIGKLARALRLVTLSNTLGALELLTKCLMASVDMLFWTFCLLACVQCVAGMLVSGLCREFIEQTENDPQYREEVYRYYGTLWRKHEIDEGCHEEKLTFSRTFLSMFEILFANWGPPCRVLVENVSEWFSLFFLLYRCVVGFALLNVVNAVFVQQTMQPACTKTASSDEELAFKQKERDVALYTRKVRKLFQSMDDSGDGALNLEEFAKLANSPKLKFWMSQLELEYHDGLITLAEFIDGAGRLKGSAKAIDVWRLETKQVCVAQISGLTGMFAATTSLLNIAALPSGAFLDRYGPRATGMFFCTLIALGCLVFAEGPHHELAYVAGFLLMGVSGPCIFNSTLSFGNLFPKHVGLITASLVGCFDASSAVFATLAHFMTDGMSFSETFHLYMDVSLDELSGRSLQNICWSVDFLLLSYTASVTMICINFFIATIFATGAFMVFAFCRPLFYSLNPAFCGQRFGFTHFGTVFGLIFTISGICNLAVQPLAALAAQHGFVPVNGFFTNEEGLGPSSSTILGPVQKIFEGSVFNHIRSVAEPRVSHRHDKPIDLQLVAAADASLAPGSPRSPGSDAVRARSTREATL
eukprot:g4577.t1